MKQRYNSEDTIKEVLDVSTKLFIEKGYEKTTIKNIVDRLDGLSKGAVYHHFSSKEEIVEGVVERLVPSAKDIEPIINNGDLKAIEKIQQLFLETLLNQERGYYFSLTFLLLNDPKFFLLYTTRINDEFVPYLVALIQEGNQDGSTAVTYPKQVAEVIVLLLNTWFSESLYPDSGKNFWQKLSVAQEIFSSLGVALLSDSLVAELKQKIKEKTLENEALTENEKANNHKSL